MNQDSEKRRSGPGPERLKIKGDCEKAVARVLRKPDQEKKEKPKPKK